VTFTFSGSFELGIAHDRSWTNNPANNLNLTTTAGNLVLNAPGNSFDAPTYVMANPTNALPGTISAGWLHTGETHPIQPSGAIIPTTVTKRHYPVHNPETFSCAWNNWVESRRGGVRPRPNLGDHKGCSYRNQTKSA